MKELTLKISDAQTYFYLRIVDAISAAIESGQVTAGERVPSIRQLAHQLGISRNTVARAVEELVAEGWLISKPRSGYYVASGLSLNHLSRKRRTVSSLVPSNSFNWKSRMHKQTASDPNFGYSPLDGSISFAASGPDVRMFPLVEFRYCLSRALRDDPLNVLGYGNAVGYGPFIEATTAYLRRVCGITNREIIVTNGSMEAYLLICQLLLGPGKVVAMEELCFFPKFQLFQLSKTEVLPLPSDESGIIPEALQDIATQRTIDLLYLTPIHQYPTTVTLQSARRRQIYEICARHEIPILEDSLDHDFHYRTQPPIPLAASDPIGLVIYVASFSSSLFPSARIGYLAVPKSLYCPLLQIRRVVSHHGDNLLQAAMAYWINDGGFERHVRRMRTEYARRSRHLVCCLSKLAESECKLSFQPPQGGLGLWLDTGRNATEVASRGLLHGVSVVPSTACHIDQGRKGSHVRLSFGCLTPDEISRGVNLFGHTLSELA